MNTLFYIVGGVCALLVLGVGMFGGWIAWNERRANSMLDEIRKHGMGYGNQSCVHQVGSYFAASTSMWFVDVHCREFFYIVAWNPHLSGMRCWTYFRKSSVIKKLKEIWDDPINVKSRKDKEELEAMGLSQDFNIPWNR